jgi:branched-chain amino acid transport system substrate-binding protein
VTKDPNSVPNIAWQTQDQRQELIAQNKEMVQTQQEQITTEPTASAAPIPVPAVPHEKVSVSLLVPLTGKKSALGQSMLKAAQMALFDIGSADFELMPRDTKSTKEGAVEAAKAAIENGDKLILGPVFAEDLKEIKAVVGDAGIPIISFTTDWTLAGDNTYIMGFLPFTQVARVARYAQEHGKNSVAVYAPQTEYCDVVINTLKQTSVSVPHVSRYEPKQLELDALIKDFAETSKNPSSPNGFDFDALMLPLGSEGLKTLVNVMDTHGIRQPNVQFIGTGLWDDATLASNPLLHGGWFAAPDPNLRQDFEKRFQENYSTTPIRLSSLAYDATALAAVLARTTYSGSTPYTRDALTNPRGFAGIDGIFRFRPDGLSERGLAVLEIRSDAPRVIDPAPTAFLAGS